MTSPTTPTPIKRPHARTAGNVFGEGGKLFLHLVKALFFIYSAYHGIHATTTYRAASGLGNLAGILGIIAIEVTLAGIYLAWVNHKITGGLQSVAAGVTYAVGFTFACLGIVGDSQLQAGLEMAPWVRLYLTTILPAAPAVMALGAFLIVMASPESRRRRNEAEDEQEIIEDEHDLTMQLRRAEAQAAAQLKAIELDTKLALAAQIRQYVSSPAAQAAIVSTAERDAPAMLRALGIYIPETTPRAVSRKEHQPEPDDDALRVPVPETYPNGHGRH